MNFHADIIFIMEVVTATFHPLFTVIFNDPTLQGIDNHFSHDCVIVDVQAVIPSEGNHHRPFERCPSDFLPIQTGLHQHVPEICILFSDRPVLPGIICIHTVVL